MKECSLGSGCYGQTLLVYPEMAARSSSGEGEGDRGGQVEEESSSRPDGGERRAWMEG